VNILRLFFDCDEFCRVFEPPMRAVLLSDGKSHRHRQSTLSASEVMTIVILFQTSGSRNFKTYYTQCVCMHLRREFPGLVSYQRFVELQSEIVLPLAAFLHTRFGSCTGISFIVFPRLAGVHSRKKCDKPSQPIARCVGSGLHPIIMSNLVNVLDFGMDLKKSIDTPNFLGPFFGMSFDGKPPAPQMYLELLAEGEFDENLFKAVVAKGQAVKLLPKNQARLQNGYWVAIQIDQKTGKRIGVATPFNGDVSGY
jgi:hypothetical protein